MLSDTKLLDTLCISIEFHWIRVNEQPNQYQTVPFFSENGIVQTPPYCSNLKNVNK